MRRACCPVRACRASKCRILVLFLEAAQSLAFLSRKPVFIEENRKRWGVEPICRVLPIAPSTYYAAKKRPPSQRALRDEYLKVQIERVWKDNFKVYGVDKIWVALNREGIRVARCTVERLMRHMGIQGATRGRKPFTTTPAGDEAARPADLVQRDFSAPAPNRLWLSDLTYVRTWSGMVNVSFVIDASPA